MSICCEVLRSSLLCLLSTWGAMCRPWILFCRSPALTLAFLTIDSSLLYESQNLATVCTDRAILAVYRRGTRGEETDFRTEDLGLTGKDAPGTNRRTGRSRKDTAYREKWTHMKRVSFPFTSSGETEARRRYHAHNDMKPKFHTPY